MTVSSRCVCGLALVAVVCTVPGRCASLRVEVSLNGEWSMAVATDVDRPPGEAQWQPFTVPGTLRSVRGDKRWFRRVVDVPAAWAGRRIRLSYDGVKFDSRHYLNGTLVGRHFRGYDPFTIDVTDGVRFGEENELLVGCCDWQATFSEAVDLADVPASDTARQVPRNVGLTPIGGKFYDFGIWADVRLVATPPVHLGDVTVRTSVREQRIRVSTTVINSGREPARVTAQAAVVASEVPAFPGKPVEVAPGETADVSWDVPWRGARLWGIEDPFLYTLHLRLSGPEGTFDECRERFGFREFWCDGPAFYLNGTRLLLRSSSMWPLGEKTKDGAAGRLRSLQDINVICFRTHTQPWRQYWYEAADEVGMLMIPEGPVFNDDTFYRLDDKRFWDNYAEELRGMTRRFRNNPSVVAYSLENEFYGSHMNDETPAKADLARMGRLVRQWDPSRPFMYESDGDPDGVADIVGVHYPHEMGEVYLYPNDCFWMDEPKRIGHQFTNGAETWLWDRKKPLYIGEYLWCPCPTPSLYTIFCGDDAYRDYGRSSREAIGRAWSMQTRAYRAYRVSGLCPWTIAGTSLDPEQHAMVAAQTESMRPLAAFCRELNSRFYSGQRIRRTLDVMNDTLDGGTVRVSWALSVRDAPIREGESSLVLGPAEARQLEVELTAPEVRASSPGTFTVVARMPGAPDFREDMPYRVVPGPILPSISRLGIFDPGGESARLLPGGLPVPDLERIPSEVDVLLIGRDALSSEADGATRAVLRACSRAGDSGLRSFLRRGGRVLLLAQGPEREAVESVRFVDRRATMVFPLWRQHPVLKGVAPDDLSFWGPDHVVADAQVSRGAAGVRPILVSGSRSGIEFSPLAERRVGGGLVVFCGLRIVRSFGKEPAAAVLLTNVLEYLSAWKAPASRVSVVGESPGLARTVERLDLDVVRVAASDNVGFAPGVCMVVDGDLGAGVGAGLLNQVAEGGGTLWWHRPDPAALNLLLAARGMACRLVPSSGPVCFRDNDSFVDGLAREDLYWPGEVALGAHSWQQVAQDPAVIEHAVAMAYAEADPERAVLTVPCAGMRVTGSEWNRPEADAMILASNGSVFGRLDSPFAGPAVIGIRAKGSVAGGGWPQVAVRLGGQGVGTVTVGHADWGLHGLRTEVRKGTNEVELAFVNDANIGGQDRNVWLSQVYLQRAETGASAAAVAHTDPAALVSVQVGKGTLLIDTIRWDAAGEHAALGGRLAASLFMKMGAQPRVIDRDVVEAEALEFEEVSYNEARDGLLVLANPGSAWVPIICETAGSYTLCVRAKGQQAADEWPVLVLTMGDEEIGRLTIDTSSVDAFLMPLELAVGEHRLELRFINDFYDPGKADRNCYLDRIELWRTQSR